MSLQVKMAPTSCILFSGAKLKFGTVPDANNRVVELSGDILFLKVEDEQ